MTSPQRVLTDVGCFVAFEGGEGAGKSTQAGLLADSLEAEGYAVLRTREPGATEVGRKVRAIVLDPATGHLSHRTEALLYAADKAEHVDEVVLPALERGEVVLTDRYVDSTLAYQGAGRGLDESLELVARWATSGLRPHLTVLLDVAPSHGLARFTERDRIEAEGLAFHDTVRQMFLQLAQGEDTYLVVDATLPADQIAARVRRAVEPFLAQAKVR